MCQFENLHGKTDTECVCHYWQSNSIDHHQRLCAMTLLLLYERSSCISNFRSLWVWLDLLSAYSFGIQNFKLACPYLLLTKTCIAWQYSLASKRSIQGLHKQWGKAITVMCVPWIERAVSIEPIFDVEGQRAVGRQRSRDLKRWPYFLGLYLESLIKRRQRHRE